MLTHRQISRAILLAIIVLVAVYLCLCYLDTPTGSGTRNLVDGFTAPLSTGSMEVSDVAVMDTLFPGRHYPISLTDGPVAHYNNLDTQLALRFTINGAPDILNNVIVSFTDITSQKPDTRWTTSRWQPVSTTTTSPSQEQAQSRPQRIFELKQYLDPNTQYRIHVQVDGHKLNGPGLDKPLRVGDQHFRALGVEVQEVDRNTSTAHGGPLDGNMGLALVVANQDGSDVETLPGGQIQLGQIQMIPYNQALFHVRIPDVRVFHQLVQRHVATKLSGSDLPEEDVARILAGMLNYTAWKLETQVNEMTSDGSRPLTEEEIASRHGRNMPRVRVEAGNPAVCVNQEQSPTGPCTIRLVGVQPGRYYQVHVRAVFNQLDSVNNYRRTLPLVFTFQAIDITGSASLMPDAINGTGPTGIADAIQEVGVKLDEFKKRQAGQDQQLDELDKMYNDIRMV